MNQDHLQQQPAADEYVIGGPSDFAEDVSPAAKGWKADLDSDGNTKRDEIGMPQYRSDTFNSPEHAPGVSPSRQASLAEVHAKAKVATRIARLMLPRAASEDVIEDQALSLMDLPISNLNNTLSRLAQEQDGDDEEDEDEGQSKQAADDEDDDDADDDDADDDDDDDDAGQSKQAKGLPPEFLENIKKKKDEAKDKDKDEGKKEARRRLRAQQQQGGESDDDEGEQQSKQARRRLKAQQQDSDDDDESQQSKQARTRKAQQQQDDEEGEEQVGKQAYSLIKQAAAALLQLPVSARATAFRVALPGLAKAASDQLGPVAQDQVQSQVQQLVQNAMQQLQQQQVAQDQAPQQQVAQGQMPQQQQQQPVAQGFGQDTLADDALVDQMLKDPGDMSEDSIQMDPPDMDLGLGGGEDPALQQIFASDTEVQRALEAQALQSGHTASSRTASTRTVGTRPTAGVSQLGGGTSGAPSTGVEEINRLAGMWSSAPDVSSVFRS